eukprot:scaffold19029_cov119-Isochrysis_galbana.AAC.9
MAPPVGRGTPEPDLHSCPPAPSADRALPSPTPPGQPRRARAPPAPTSGSWRRAGRPGDAAAPRGRHEPDPTRAGPRRERAVAAPPGPDRSGAATSARRRGWPQLADHPRTRPQSHSAAAGWARWPGAADHQTGPGRLGYLCAPSPRRT